MVSADSSTTLPFDKVSAIDDHELAVVSKVFSDRGLRVESGGTGVSPGRGGQPVHPRNPIPPYR